MSIHTLHFYLIKALINIRHRTIMQPVCVRFSEPAGQNGEFCPDMGD